MLKSNQILTLMFTTQSASTGALTDAAPLPGGAIYVNGTFNAAAVTVTNISTGLYKAAVTLPALAIGDVAAVVVAATVDGVAGKGVWHGTCTLDSNGRSDAGKVNGSAAAAALLALIAQGGVSTTASGGTSSTIILASAPDYSCRNRTLIHFPAGGGQQIRQITAHTGGGATVTVGTLSATPSNGDVVIILPAIGLLAADVSNATLGQPVGEEPWGAGTVGGVLANLDATVGSRATPADVTGDSKTISVDMTEVRG